MAPKLYNDCFSLPFFCRRLSFEFGRGGSHKGAVGTTTPPAIGKEGEREHPSPESGPLPPSADAEQAEVVVKERKGRDARRCHKEKQAGGGLCAARERRASLNHPAGSWERRRESIHITESRGPPPGAGARQTEPRKAGGEMGRAPLPLRRKTGCDRAFKIFLRWESHARTEKQAIGGVCNGLPQGLARHWSLSSRIHTRTPTS